MSRSVRILMVEDDPDYRQLVERWLGPHYALRFGTRLDETWHELDQCDLVLLDLGLPDARGMETLVAARELAGELPIVVLTGLDDAELGQQAVEAGADVFLPKRKAGAETLQAALDEALAKRQGSGRPDCAARVSAAFAKAGTWVA